MNEQLDTAGAVAAYLNPTRVDPDPAQGARVGVSVGLGANPDYEAELKQVARRTGVPVDTVRAYPDELKRQAQMGAIDFNGLAERFPRTAGFLTGVENAKIAHDDIENMGLIETLVNSFKRGVPALRSMVPTLELVNQSAGLNTYRKIDERIAAGEDPKAVLSEYGDYGLAPLPWHNSEQALAGWNAFKARAIPAMQARAGEAAADVTRFQAERNAIPLPGVVERTMAAKTWGDAFSQIGTDPLRFIAAIGPESLVQTAPGLLAAIPAGIAGGPLGSAATIGGNSALVDYASSLVEAMQGAGVDVANPDAIRTALKDPEVLSKIVEQAGKHAAVVGAFDALSGGIAGKMVLPKTVADKLAGRPLAQEMANIAMQVPVQATLGAAGEAGGELYSGQELQPGNILAEAFGEFFGTPGEVVSASAKRIHEKIQAAREAEATAVHLQQLDELAKASKVRARDADTFESFVKSATEDGPLQDVFIDAKTLMQSGMAEQVAAASPSVAAQLSDALATGGDIKIPVAEYASRLAGTEYSQGLLDHLKTEPNGMSRAEAQEFMQSQAEVLKAEVEKTLAEKQGDEQFKAQAEAVKNQVREQLDQVSRFTGPVNDAYASMVSNFYAVMAAKLGITPQELFARYPLKVAAERLAGDQVLDQGPVQYQVNGEVKFAGNPDPSQPEQMAVAAVAKGGIEDARRIVQLYRDEATNQEWVDQFEQAVNALADQDVKMIEPEAPKAAAPRASSGSEPDLIVTHNLSAKNLLHAVKVGGIAVPSLAVTKKDTPLTGFGEITLIGPKEMADPKGYAGTKVFGADIYSPRYPSVEYHIPPKELKAAKARMEPAEKATGFNMDWSDIQRNGARELEYSAPVMWTFLIEQGIDPEIVAEEGVSPERLARLQDQGFAPYLENKSAYQMADDPAFIELAAKAQIAEYVDSGRAERYKGIIESLRNDEAARRRTAMDRAREIAGIAEKMSREPQPDRYKTRDRMQTQIREAGLQEDFEQYTQDFLEALQPVEKIFKGWSNSGNKTYTPHTLDNVVKILKKELRGGENFNYGVGSLRAKFTPQFKSIEQIRKAKGRLVDKAAFESVKKEIDDEYMAVAQAMSPDLPLDTVTAILEDAPKMGLDRAAKQFQVELSPEAKTMAAGFLNKLRDLPTEYFEAKVLREVDLAEFAGAVVPEGVNPKVIDALKARGVTDIRTYKKGDEADRATRIAEFDHLFFQDKGGARGAFNPATNTITLLKNADLSTFLHESGHFFLETQFDIAAKVGQEAAMFGADTNKPGEAQILKDTQALLKWFGIESLQEWYGLDFEQKRSYHEQFARGFEAYLFEGNAPSIELQGLFQRFRAWLLNVYRELKNLNVELTDEVRSVFDRMLATTDEIKLAEQGRSMMPLFTAPEQAGMTPEEFAAYQALGVDATNDAIQDVQARGLRDLAWTRNARGREIKRLQREAAATRAEVTMEVRREVMSQPIYRAWQFLTGKITAEDKIEPNTPPKSSPDSVNPEIDSLLPAIAKLGGISRESAAQHLGVHEDYHRTPSGVFGKPAFRKEGGLSADGMAEALAELGYLPKDEHGKHDLRDLEDRLAEELHGNPQYSYEHDYSQAQGEQRAGEGVNLEALGAGRFDLAELKSMGLPAEIVEHIENLKMTAKNGIHPDLVAELFGFSSGDELVRTLAAHEAPKVEIEGLTDQRMLERYGEVATPAAIERAADKAIHNEARARFVATEANALAKATGSPKILASAARDFARTMIARLKIRDIRPGQYAAAEVRAAKAAEKASKAGDLAQAAAEKRNQLVNTFATRAAYDAQEEVDKGLRYLKKFDGEGVRKGLDADYTDQIDALLERFDLRQQSLKAIDKRTALAEWIKSQREQGLEPDIPAQLENEAFRKSHKDMTVEEFRGLVDTVKQIEHLGRLKNRLLTAADNRAFGAVRDEIAASIEEHAGNRTADTRTPTTNLGRALQTMKRFYATHIKAATWARVMDGGRDGGPMWEYFVRSANERGDMETTMRAEATGRLAEILAPVFKLGKMGGKGQFFASIGRSLNREARIAIALNTGNEGNLQRLLGGEGWTVAQIMPVLQSLTAAEWRAVQGVWNHFESYRAQIGAKERRVYGKAPTWVDPKPFQIQTADGETLDLQGGYYPIKYDPAASQRAEEHADAEGAKRQLQGAYTSATTRRSFTKSRAEEVSGRPLLYTLAGLYSGVNDVIHDLAWHEWLIDANRLLRSKTIDNAIRTHYGPEAKAQFKTWANDIAEGEKGADNAGELALSRLRQGVSAAGLGFNVMSALMQPLGLTQSIVRVGAPWIGRGVARYLASPLDSTREVNAKSEFMANRARTRFRELNELRNQVQDQSATKELIGRYAYFLMMRCQQMVDTPTWIGAYEKAIAAGNEEERAIGLADQAVIDAQGGGQTKDLASIERGGPALKLFTVFYSFMNTALNIGVAQTMTASSKAKLAADYLLLFVVPPVLGYMLKQALTPGDDSLDDPEKLAKELLAQELDYLMGLMVVVREFAEAAKIITGANDKGRDYTGPAGLRLVSDSVSLAKQAHQGEFDDAFRKAAVNVVGDLFGLPSAQVNRTITGTQAIAEGKTSNPAAVVFGYQEKR
jgi:hypothetical protein